MAKGDWLYRRMKRIGPDMMPSRQLTRQLRRQNTKRQRSDQKRKAADQAYEALCDRVHERQQAGKRAVVWPQWWRGAPTGPL